MVQEFTEGLDSLTAILPQLNSAIAEATAIVHAVDQFLSEELAVGPWVASRPFDTQRAIGDDGRELLVTSHLACGRVAGKYRLHILNATLDRAEGKDQFTQIIGEERTPWLSCSREVRLQSFSMLPELLSLLATKVSEITSQTTKTVEAVRDVLKSMGRYPSTVGASPTTGYSVSGVSNGNGHAAHAVDDDSYGSSSSGFVMSAGSDLFKRPKVK